MRLQTKRLKKTQQGKILLSFLLVFCFVMFGAVLSADTVSAAKAGKLSPSSMMLAMGGTKTVTLSKGKGTWEIQDPQIATLKKVGKKSATIVPKAAGNTVLTCTTGGKQLQCKVRVLTNEIGPTPKFESKLLVKGKKVKYAFPLDPEDADAADADAADTGEGDAAGCVDATGDTGGDVAAGSFDAAGDIGDSATVSKSEVVDAGDAADHAAAVGALASVTCDPQMAKLEWKVKGDEIIVTFHPKAVGTLPVTFTFESGWTEVSTFRILPGFRGKTNVKNTAKNYRKWRREFLNTIVTEDTTTWDIINCVGTVIGYGTYGGKGKMNGRNLWYSGKGTCISGAKMMRDFMKDIGVNCKVHFAGRDGGAKDIYGWHITYASGHRNNILKLGGHSYTLNPQPGVQWPIGIIKRK